MAQKPVLTAALLPNDNAGGYENTVAREVFGVTSGYGDLSDEYQADFLIEGNAAFMDVTEIGKWYTDVAPATEDLPTEFNELFRATWVAKCKRRWRSPQDYHAHMTQYVLPLERRIAEHYTADWDADAILQDDSISVGQLRRATVARLVRQRTPVYAPVIEIDRTIRDEFVKLWGARRWEFTKRPVLLTFDTDGNVLVEGGYTFDGMASKKFVIRTTSGTRYYVYWVDSTRDAEHMARYYGVTGRPQYFYDIDAGAIKSIKLLPTPDEVYTAFTVIYIAAPPFTTLDNPDTSTVEGMGIPALPAEFRAHLRECVVAKLMSDWGREDGDAMRMVALVKQERLELADNWDDKGSSRSTARGHHHDKYTRELTSYDGSNVIGAF